LQLPADLAELAFHGVLIIELIKESFEIANRQAITVYDAFYVALAEGVNASLITADENLVARLSGSGLPLKSIADLGSE